MTIKEMLEQIANYLKTSVKEIENREIRFCDDITSMSPQKVSFAYDEGCYIQVSIGEKGP